MFSKRLDEVYTELQKEFAKLDLKAICEKVGFEHTENKVGLKWFTQDFVVDIASAEIKTLDGHNVNLREKIMIMHHLCTVDMNTYHSGTWASVVELKQASLLASSSKKRIIDPAAELFSGKLDMFKMACEKIGGVAYNKGDASYIIQIMPEIKMLLIFNDKDDEFEASLSVLFESTIESWTHAGDVNVLVETVLDYITKILRGDEDDLYGIDNAQEKLKVTILYVSETENTSIAAEYLENGLKQGSKHIEVKRMNISYDDGYDEEFIKESRAVIFGSPVYHSNMQWKLKRWFDVSIRVRLGGKLGCAFATENSTTGGAEITILTIYQHMITKGMMVYNPPEAHIGAIGIGQHIEQYEKHFTKYGKQFGAKVEELFLGR